MVFSALRFNSFALHICAVAALLWALPLLCKTVQFHRYAVLILCNTLQFHFMAHLRPCYASHSVSFPPPRCSLPFSRTSALFTSAAYQINAFPLPFHFSPGLFAALPRSSVLYLCCSLRIFATAKLCHRVARQCFSTASLCPRAAFQRLCFSLQFLCLAIPKLCVSGHFRSFSQQRRRRARQCNTTAVSDACAGVILPGPGIRLSTGSA